MDRTDAYAEDWRRTFDLRFLVGWLVAFAILLIYTLAVQPEFMGYHGFIAVGVAKVVLMCLAGCAGGLLCRHFCKVDDHGYIVDGSHDWFKVNYTRKLQHFAAYLIPLIGSCVRHPVGILPHIWESMMVMLAFLLLIKPIRERSTFFMLQFNSMDRPEDRPNTLRWIISGNIIPALVLGVAMQEMFERVYERPELALLVVLIVGIGDGLAEPVGIYLGKHKYTVPAWNFKRRYTRSIEGSACVWICSLLLALCFWSSFGSIGQLVFVLLLLPPAMTFAEAYAPHSMDTPTMMITGAVILALGCSLF